MDHIHQAMPNVMPDALVEPITDMELVVAKLQYDGEQNKHSKGNPVFDNRNKEV